MRVTKNSGIRRRLLGLKYGFKKFNAHETQRLQHHIYRQHISRNTGFKKVNAVLLLHKFLVLIVDEYNLRDIHYFWSGFESKEKSATIT